MALWRRKQRLQPELKDVRSLGFPKIDGQAQIGYYLAANVQGRATAALRSLNEISTATNADRSAVIRAAVAVTDLAWR